MLHRSSLVVKSGIRPSPTCIQSSYQHSAERQEQLDLWMHNYNFHRARTSLNLNAPASRSGLNRNNLLRLHS